MGGRKGHSLQKIVGDLRKVKEEQKRLVEGIKKNHPIQIVKASAGILSKSDKSLDALAYSYVFADSIQKDYKKLSVEETKERRKEISHKWADFRKEAEKQFDPETNREIVDSATRIFGGEK